MNMLGYNLRDNVNSYIMKEDGTYDVKKSNNKTSFNIHKEFFKVTKENVENAELFK
jgi:polyphosphate kinase